MLYIPGAIALLRLYRKLALHPRNFQINLCPKSFKTIQVTALEIIWDMRQDRIIYEYPHTLNIPPEPHGLDHQNHKTTGGGGNHQHSIGTTRRGEPPAQQDHNNHRVQSGRSGTTWTGLPELQGPQEGGGRVTNTLDSCLWSFCVWKLY